MKRWMQMEPDDEFTALKLNTAGEKMFNSAQLNAWGNIVDEFNTLNPDKKTNLIAAITKNYGDAGAVTLLEAAKKVPASAVTATRLQREQLKYWLSIRKNQVKCSERSSSTRRETSSWRALSSACG